MADVVVEGRCFQYGFNGISLYSLEVANRLAELGNNVTVIHQNTFKSEYKFHKSICHIYEPVPLFAKFPSVFWLMFLSSRLFKTLSSSSQYVAGSFIPLNLKMKTVVIYFDLMHIYAWRSMSLSHLLTHWLFYKLAGNRADLIVSISKGTQKKLKKHFGFVANIILHPPFTLPQPTQDTIFSRYLQNINYLLFVGNLDPRKNLIQLIREHDKFNETNHNDLKLVVAGKIPAAFRQAKKNKNTIFIDAPTPETLSQLYMNAAAVIVPSKYEGYGMPAMEGAKFGKLVYITELEELQEAAGENARIFKLSEIQRVFSACSNEIDYNKPISTSNFETGINEIHQKINA